MCQTWAERWESGRKQASKVPAGMELTFHWGKTQCVQNIRQPDCWKEIEAGLVIEGEQRWGWPGKPAGEVSLGPSPP